MKQYSDYYKYSIRRYVCGSKMRDDIINRQNEQVVEKITN